MANNWAIVVGINHYEYHPQRQLNYAVADAQLIHNFLCTEAGFSPEHIFLCLSNEASRASDTYPRGSKLSNLLTQDLHPNHTGKIDRLWFYFSGHGVSRNGRDYLLPADSPVGDIDFRFALPIDEVIAALRKHQTADIVLILDSCRQLQGSRKLTPDSIGEQTIALARDRGITTIFSCEYGQYSYELGSLKQGAFTYALVEGLKQHTLPSKLEPYLRRKVAELNRHHDQTPRIIVSASKASQSLLPSAITSADLTVLIDRAKEAELEEQFEEAKELWWQAIEVIFAQLDDRLDNRIRNARTAFERIDRKIARLGSECSTSKLSVHSEFSVIVTLKDCTVLVEQAERAELSKDFETAKQIWWRIIEIVVAQVADQLGDGIQEAHTALKRIYNEIAQLESDRVASKSSQSTTNPAFEPRNSSDDRADKSIDDNQILNPLFHPMGPFTDGLAGFQAATGVDLSRPQLITSEQLGKAKAYELQMKQKVENAKKFYKIVTDISNYSTSLKDPSSFSDLATSTSIPTLQTFKFEVVTVNAQGREVDRRVGQAEFFAEDLGNGVTLEMVKIPGGSFKMGSPNTEEGKRSYESPQHTVNVPSFFIGRFVVTQAQYQTIMGNNPAHFKGEKRPVEKVLWNDAIKFCNQLSEKTGRKYRLPSEAEWEYACRAETTTPFHFGETITSALANYDASSVYRSELKSEYRQRTTDVGTFPPNAFGLYDMHGNVWEWCADHWNDNYQDAPIDGSIWLNSHQNVERLMRGGSWLNGPLLCRSAYRLKYGLDVRGSNLGFRVCCSLA